MHPWGWQILVKLVPKPRKKLLLASPRSRGAPIVTVARKPNLYIKIGSSEFSGRFLRGSGAIFYVSNRWQKGGGAVGPGFQLERPALMTKSWDNDLKVTAGLLCTARPGRALLSLVRLVQ